MEIELAEQKRINETLSKKVTQIEENNKMLKMKQDLAKGSFPLAGNKSSEELKRAIYLLEKDVVFLEQSIYDQQRMFVTVLLGLKTDLLIIGDNLTDPATGKIVDKDFARLCEITNHIYEGMLQGELGEAQKQLPPHYGYLPTDFKIKRIKRVSRSKVFIPDLGLDDETYRLPPLRHTSMPEMAPMKGQEVRNIDLVDECGEDPIVENPVLIDPISKTVNTTSCMRYFPHMSMDFIRDHWTRFQELDADGNECLDFGEVVKALTSMGFKFTAQQAEEAMREADVNKSRTLDFYEYLLVADKLFSKKGHSELFHTGAATENRKAIAKTCVIQ